MYPLRIEAAISPVLAAWLAAPALLGPAAADLPAIKARGTLRVLVSEGEPAEMFSLQRGGRPGFERDLLEGFASLNRLKLVVVPVRDREGRLPALLRGEGDVVVGLVDSEDRRRQIDFTQEVLPAHHVVVTSKPHRVVRTIDELRAERIAIVDGASWSHAITAAGVPASRTETFPDRVTALEAVRSGRATATVMSVPNFVLTARRIPSLQAGMFFGAPGHSAWGIRKEDDQLQRALDDYLANVRKTPSWSRLVVEYFGDQALEVLGRLRR